jgi:hypothetical protein
MTAGSITAECVSDHVPGGTVQITLISYSKTLSMISLWGFSTFSKLAAAKCMGHWKILRSIAARETLRDAA